MKSEKANNAIHTMLSVNAKNQLEMLAIADNKANMITAICVAINFMIIALLCLDVSLLDSKLTNSIEFILPMGILVSFCTVSIICGILALKPKIIRAHKSDKSALFFHNTYRKSLDEYRESLVSLMENEEQIYDHMMRNMYFNDQVLERKYTLLGIAYQIFLLAIICSGMAYVIATVS